MLFFHRGVVLFRSVCRQLVLKGLQGAFPYCVKLFWYSFTSTVLKLFSQMHCLTNQLYEVQGCHSTLIIHCTIHSWWWCLKWQKICMFKNTLIKHLLHKASDQKKWEIRRKKEKILVWYYGKHALRSPTETPVAFLSLYRHFGLSQN